MVVDREAAIEAKFGAAAAVPASAFVDGLAENLPEFRRDFLAAAAANFGPVVAVAGFLDACRRAYADLLRKHAAAAADSRVGRAAHAALAAADGGRSGMLEEEVA